MPTSATSLSDDAGGDSSAEIHSNQMQPTGGDLGTAVRMAPPPPPPHPSALRRSSGSAFTGGENAGAAFLGSTTARRNSPKSASTNTDIMRRVGSRRHQSHAGQSSHSAIKSITGGAYTIHLDGDDGGVEMKAAQPLLNRALHMREGYKGVDKGQTEGLERLPPPVALHVDNGTYLFSGETTKMVSWEQFYDDLRELQQCVQNPYCQSASCYRLNVLEEKYNIYKVCNGELEESTDRYRHGGGVFANSCKVDNYVQMNTMMNAQSLVEFIQETIDERGEDVVMLAGDLVRDRVPQTLQQTCEMLEFDDPAMITVDSLGLQPSLEKPNANFDALNPDLNRGGSNSSDFLRLFLTPNTINKGAYLAEMVREALNANEEKTLCVQATETAVEITGLIPEEWEDTAKWIKEKRLDEYRQNRWSITLPRRKMRAAQGSSSVSPLVGGTGNGSGNASSAAAAPGRRMSDNPITFTENSGMRSGTITHDMANANGDMDSTFENHQQHLEALFLPLFLATIAPEDPKNADIANLLLQVGSFVIEFNEEERDVAVSRKTRRPADVPWTENVPDAYFSYYVWTNIASLNALRRRRGLNVFQLRSVAGAARSPQHVEALALSYLLCDHIVNGLALEMQPVMQYLFGVQRIGVSMCPLRCSTLSSVAYPEHPFTTLFRRGLRVSLSTVSPLYLHHSINPLTEEYGVASKVLRLSPVDVSEIALNSVLISSFEDVVKGCWIGDGFVREGWRGNSYEITSVPTSRLELRDHMWRSEMQLISVRSSNAGAEAPSASNTIAVPSIAINPAGGPLMPSSGPTSTFTIADADDGSVGFTNANSTAVSRRETTVSAGVDDTTVNNNNSTATATALHGVQAPWTVIDPRIRCTRLHLVGPYDRDMQHTMVAHNLHRAMELRAQYTRSSNAATAGQRSQKQQAPQRGGVAGTELYRLTQQASQIEHAFKKEKTDAFDEDEWMYKTVEGVVVPHEVHQIPRLPKEMHHYEDFRSHVQELRAIVENYHVRGFCARRLQLLENRFKLHVAVNHSLEAGSTADRASQNRDFYQSTKIDNNVRMETGMTARQLLDFIVSKAHNSGDDIVSHQKGREPQTLRQLLSELNISAETLTVDDLNVQVDTTLNVGAEQYTPEGRDELLTLLLKTDNQMKGRYFAELTKLTFENFKRDRFTFTENRLPVYGASATEWELMSSWYDTHGMSSIHNQWMIQIPRIYGYLRKQNKVQSFAEYIENIFKPLWNVSLHPSKDPRLFHFVNHISGFDCVEDERRPDQPLGADTRPPHEWVSEEDPPYNYYMYHLWANIYSLNEFRRRRNFSTFSFRPSCGETGQMDHLIGGFLLSNGINYGVQLGDEDPLQYLFYLAQVGVTLSPLSNNTKVLSYLDNPFPKLFRRGLMVTLGTDSPLMYHHTQEPLLEEYSIASKIWKLSPNDMCEIARNSVLQSGFGPAFKQERLGELFFLSSSLSNDASRTHLSDVRVGYRFETYHSEIGFLEYISGQTFQKSLLTLPEEEQWQNDFYESVRHRNVPPPINSIIDSNPNEADIEKLTNQRAAMRKELEELSTTMADLQRQNKQLTEKLAEERYRDQQAAQLRRRLVEGKAEDIGELLLDNAGMPNGFTFLRGAPDATDASADAGIDGAVEAAAVPGVNMDQRSREYWPLVGDGEAKKRIAGDNKHLPNSDSALHGEVPVGGSGTTAPDNTTRQSSSPHTPSLSNKNLPSPSNTTGASRNTPDMADGGNGSTAAAPTPSKRPENPGSLLSHSESLWRRPAAPVKAAATPREEESSSPTAGPTLRSGTAALVPETDSHSDSGVALPRLPVAPRPLPPPPQRRDN